MDHPSYTSVLSFVGPDSQLYGHVTLTFHHARQEYSPIVLTIPYLPQDTDLNILQSLTRYVGDKTFDDIIDELSAKLNIPVESIILHHIQNGVDRIVFPFTKISDFFNSMFATNGIVVDTGELEFELYVSPFNTKNKFPVRHIETNEESINQFSSNLYDALDISPSQYIPVILESIYKYIETKTLPLSNDELDVIKSAVKTVVESRLFEFILKYFKLDRTIEYKMEELGALFNPLNLKNTSIRQEVDIKLLIGASLSKWRTFPQDIVNRFHQVLVSMQTKRKPQNVSYFGTVVYSQYVNVNNLQYTLILTYGFLHLMNFSPKVTDHHEVLPESYHFNCSNTKPLLFGAPVQCVKFVKFHPDNNIGLLSTPNGYLGVDLKKQDALNDFWLMFSICQFLIQLPFVKPPIPRLIIHYSFPVIGDDRAFSANIEAGNDNWSINISYEKFTRKMNKIFARCRKVQTMVSLDSPLPKINEFLRTDSVISYLNRMYSFRNIVEQINVPEFHDYDLMKSACFELSFSSNQNDQYNFFKILGVSKFKRSFTIGSVSLFQFQIQNFGSMVETDRIQSSPLLHFACLFSDDYDMLRLLMNNFNINEQDDDQRSALFYSIRNPSLFATQLLFEHNINPNKVDKSSDTPLIASIRNGFSEMTTFLARQGTSLNRTLLEFHNPSLVYAILFHKTKTFKKLIKICPTYYLNFPTRQGKFLTHVCLDAKSPKALYSLAPKCPDFDPNRYTDVVPHPLHYFFNRKPIQSIRLFKALLSLPNLDLNVYNKSGHTVLCKSIQSKSILYLKALVADPRCNLDFQNKNGRTPLSIAVELQNLEAVKVLISAGALINAPNDDEEGNTPLMIAVKLKNVEIVNELLAKGAKADVWYNSEGVLPKHIANDEIKRILEESGYKEEYLQLENV
ncbi:ankyrin repeat protein [Histomonas meleagridis]|uniref:ankyrin repeat protein n=1 Tax=Histomonas meleagridis TaxID=135588 RepID=UPI00355AA298|nr:ankyrin repeat protein [Histomonas meleagridis]KAH0800418.1 ankyrin repeat protein [Histomonas meleagridis]